MKNPKEKMKVAAVQMKAKLGDIKANMDKAERLVENAFSQDAKMVILPEFFTTSVAFHPSLLDGALPFDGPALNMLQSQAKKHSGYVGGSFIASRGGDRYNTFVLAMPDGSYSTHDKDQPTMWENCWYIGGHDDGIIQTPEMRVGIAMCWEFIRTRTPKRLLGKIDLLAGGSCWWTVPDWWFARTYLQKVHRQNVELIKDTPSRMAKLLGVPVIHASHAGDIECDTPMMPGLPWKSYMMGETQIVDAEGKILACMAHEDGEGVITAEIEIGSRPPSEKIPNRFWIPASLPPLIRFAWAYQNLHGKFYYKEAKKAGRLNL